MKLKYLIIIFFTLSCLSCAGLRSKNKGDIFLDVSALNYNNIIVAPEDERTKIHNTLLNLGLDLEYFHSDNQFIDLGFYGAISMLDMPFTILAAIDPPYDGTWESETIYTFTANLSNNHIIDRFTIGYGLSYIRNSWHYNNYIDHESINSSNKIIDSIGFCFPFHFQINKLFDVGIIYWPTFFRPKLKDKIKYEHLIGLDFSFKLHLNKNRHKQPER